MVSVYWVKKSFGVITGEVINVDVFKKVLEKLLVRSKAIHRMYVCIHSIHKKECIFFFLKRIYI